jgi:hypothetical protein
MNSPEKVRYTNFEGDWDSNCEFCSKSHRLHQVELGELEGTKLIHRQPCPEEQYAINKRLVTQSVILRTILFFYNLGKYVWGKIPFKEEAKLLLGFVKHIFISVRAFIYLGRQKPK